MKIPAIILTWIFIGMPHAKSATYIHAFNGIGTEITDSTGTLLYAGTDFFSDGNVYQIGHFIGATSSSPFEGEWVPLKSLTIGDKGIGNLAGRFDFNDLMNPLGIVDGQPLAIRFYDATSITKATFLNTVTSTSNSWTWISSPTVRADITLSLEEPGLLWQGGNGSAFQTVIPVPEASTAWLASGLLLICGLSQRRRPRSITRD